jgi:hypothetical protein
MRKTDYSLDRLGNNFDQLENILSLASKDAGWDEVKELCLAGGVYTVYQLGKAITLTYDWLIDLMSSGMKLDRHFFDSMLDNNLLDVTEREWDTLMAYCRFQCRFQR